MAKDPVGTIYLFLDESYRGKTKEEANGYDPYFYMGGILGTEDQVKRLDGAITAYRQALVALYDLPAEPEFHGWVMMATKSEDAPDRITAKAPDYMPPDTKGWNVDRCQQWLWQSIRDQGGDIYRILDNLMYLVNQSGVHGYIKAVHRPQLEATRPVFKDKSSDLIATQYLLMDINQEQWRLAHDKEVTRCVVDKPHTVKVTIDKGEHYEEICAAIKEIRIDGVPGAHACKYEYILDDITPGDSSKSNCLQMADIVAYIMRRTFDETNIENMHKLQEHARFMAHLPTTRLHVNRWYPEDNKKS